MLRPNALLLVAALAGTAAADPAGPTLALDDEIHGLALSPDGRQLAVASERVQLCAAATLDGCRAIGKTDLPRAAVWLARDAVAVADGQRVAILDAASGAERATTPQRRGLMKRLIAAGGDRLVAAGADEVLLLDGRTARILWSAPFESTAPASLAVSPDGALVAVGTEDHRVQLLDARDGHAVRSLDAGAAVRAVAFTPDGAGIVAGVDDDRPLRLFATATGRALEAPADQPGNAPYAFAVSPDRKRLAVGGADQAVRIYDLATWKQLQVLAALPARIQALVWSPDGKTLVAGGDNGKAVLLAP